MEHQTDDPAERAASIADNEAEKVWQKTGNYDKWASCWQEVYSSALREIAYSVAI